LIENREIFIPHLYLVPPQGVAPSEFREMFDANITTPCPGKKGATDFFAVTFTNIDGFS